MKNLTWTWAVALLLGTGAAWAESDDIRGFDESPAKKGTAVQQPLKDKPLKHAVETGAAAVKAPDKAAYLNATTAVLETSFTDIRDLRQKVQSMGGDHAALLKDLDDLQDRHDRISGRLGQLRDSKAKVWKSDHEQIDQMMSDYTADLNTIRGRVNAMTKVMP